MSVESPEKSVASERVGWQSFFGEFVEIFRSGVLYRRGLVDAVMPDGSGLWIAAEGALGRELVWDQGDFTVRRSASQGAYPTRPRTGDAR